MGDVQDTIPGAAAIWGIQGEGFASGALAKACGQEIARRLEKEG